MTRAARRTRTSSRSKRTRSRTRRRSRRRTSCRRESPSGGLNLQTELLLFPDSFWPLTRSAIAKIRYQALGDHIDARLPLYGQAKQHWQSAASCFHRGPNASLQADIDTLTTELTDVGQHLDQVHADGLVQAAQDRPAVENKGRLRNDLVHPSLTDRERDMLAFGARCFRLPAVPSPKNGGTPCWV